MSLDHWFHRLIKTYQLNNVKNPNRIALVIGNENYANSLNAEINVEFARHDADVFRNYAISLLGVQTENMFFLTDATSGKWKGKSTGLLNW